MKHKMYLIKNSLCFVWIFLMSACSIVATELPFDKKIIERDLLQIGRASCRDRV